MLTAELLAIPGEHSFLFDGEVGQLEAIITVPAEIKKNIIALLGHPHSLQGGTMHNKVVTTLARSFKDTNIISIRFNFRGVGNSGGEYDAGLGESRDMILLMQQCLAIAPESKFIFAGFSFGSYVAYRAAALSPHLFLITIAPAVNHCNYKELGRPEKWHIIHGDIDEVVPWEDVANFAENAKSAIPITRFLQTGHFFHGQLLVLRSTLTTIIENGLGRA